MRDLGALCDYQVCRVRLFDMFPHTAHYETLVLLERRAPRAGRRRLMSFRTGSSHASLSAHVEPLSFSVRDVAYLRRPGLTCSEVAIDADAAWQGQAPVLDAARINGAARSAAALRLWHLNSNSYK